METLDVESRRYHRVRCPVRLHVTERSAPSGVPVLSFDVSTGGGSFDLPAGACPFTEGDQVTVAVPMRTPASLYVTPAVVRHCTPLPADGAAPARTRVGVQFREALLLHDVAFEDVA